jgi:agmatine deiminase
MPAEWDPHAATWLAWPHNPDTWLDKLSAAPPVWCEMVRALIPHEPVNILVNSVEVREKATAALTGAKVPTANVRFHRIPTNDAWIRDFGPIFVHADDGEQVILDWRYNAWGGKYPPYDDDDKVRVRVAETLGLRHHSPGLTLEGGALEVNGHGTLLTNERSLINDNRNPGRSRSEIEAVLKESLGVRKVLWLCSDMAGDETDGHIDIMARFVDATTVVVMVEEDPKDDNYEPLQDNLRRLQSMTDQDGQPLRVVPLKMPRRMDYKHLRLPASYANFYIANRVVLVPVYGDAQDRIALETLSRLMPGRTMAAIDSHELLIGGGAIHCVTQQQPAPLRS